MATRPEKIEHVRLKRFGPNDSLGLGQYFLEGKLYKRAGIYRVDRATARRLVATSHFERIHDDDVEEAKAKAHEPRGVDLATKVRNDRREARHAHRGDGASVGDDLIDTGAGEGLTV